MRWPDNLPWTVKPGVREHCERTGEKPPHQWDCSPADMRAHGGYAIVVPEDVAIDVGTRVSAVIGPDKQAIGPYAWAENAMVAASPHGGSVVSWRWAMAQAARWRERIEQIDRAERSVLAHA